jgi:hypothetical protein
MPGVRSSNLILILWSVDGGVLMNLGFVCRCGNLSFGDTSPARVHGYFGYCSRPTPCCREGLDQVWEEYH